MEVAYLTDPGNRRGDNEDYVGAFQNQSGLWMLIVADGVTSNEGGEVASAMAVEHFGNAWESTSIEMMKATVDWLKNRAQLENDAMLQAGERFRDLSQMATTLIIAVIFNQQLLLANLGDSKAFRLHDNQLTQLSFDHSLKNELLRTGRITKADAEQLPNANSLTRYLGVDTRVDLEISQHEFLPSNILLLTSDGITKVLTKDDIKATLSQYDLTLEERANALVQQANDNDVPDNVTALLCQQQNEKD
ncbi:protein phosphatase 2C domain-containing protein [Leuconostoc fallax]|uniref:protein phosphatase 2C domain-containing protein n=1 Tax=Leuconostoc fallax TaxID=1251 RepID=UPI002091D54C|nr:protein phosphatase 2C domain-containing protein [Leuconostoc fallax]MCO6183425.1 protein phosphatase 2C domain-containing protein [Leuconostoc fallax]